MEPLYKLKEVDTVHDIHKVRNLYDKNEAHIRGLLGLGINKAQYEPILIPLIMGQIPGEFRLVISREFDKGAWDINGLLETFRTQIDVREHCEIVSKHNQKDQVIGKDQGPYQQQHQ